MNRDFDSGSATSSSNGSSRQTTGTVGSSLDSEKSAIEKDLRNMEDVQLPAAKAPGTAGRKINLFSNYYKVTAKPNYQIYMFDIKIKPEDKFRRKEEKRRFFTAFASEIAGGKLAAGLAYDGQAMVYYKDDKGILGNDKVKEGFKTFRFDYAVMGRRKTEFEVCLKKVGFVSTNDIHRYLNGHADELDQQAVQACDVVLRHSASTSMVCVGRNFYPPQQDNVRDLGSGREVWFGYHQSLRAVQGKGGIGALAMNIDSTATAFMREIPMIEMAKEVLRARDLRDLGGRGWWSDSRRKQFEKDVGKIQIMTTHLKENKLYRMTCLTRTGASMLKFEQEENGQKRVLNVADYYSKTYKLRLKYPDAPCIQVGTKNVKYFPLEFCRVAPRQASKGKLNDQMTSQMIRAVAVPAPATQQRIQKQAELAQKNASAMAKQYGMEISTQMQDLVGRVARAPKIEFKAGRKEEPRNGVWDMRNGAGFIDPKAMKTWVILNWSRASDRDIENFAQQLKRAANNSGMDCMDHTKLFNCRDAKEIENRIQQCAGNKMQLVIVVLSHKNVANYSSVKTYSEIRYGVMTQCILEKNVQRCNPQLCGNLLQKINTKLGGINSKICKEDKIQLFTRPTMVVGISVSNPSPQSNAPTIVSMVFSVDAGPSKYIPFRKIQKERFQIVADITNLMKEGLKAFYRSTKGKKPEKIIIYRGGASDSQHQFVVKHEVAGMKTAFAQIGGNYNPGLTVISVNKRHHTRAFAKDERDRIGKSGNVPAGTIIDSTVTNLGTCNWYLNSAQGIQGTTRAGHYTLLHDDNNMTMDSLQIMTWHLCHGYARCTRSVSLPIPVFYADLDRERAAHHLHENWNDEMSVASGDNGPNVEALAQNLKIHATLENVMYYV